MQQKFRNLVVLSFLFVLTGVAIELSPSPKECVFSGKQVRLGYAWNIAADGDFKEAAQWLQEEFLLRGWSISSEAVQKLNIKKIANPTANREFYSLEISEGVITLSAAESEGSFRAVGRLLGILKNPDVQYGAETFALPELTLRDYPDIPLRVMDLTMTFWEPFSAAERLDSTKKIISILSMHGFNAVVIALGGNYVSKHFPSLWQNPWTEKDIREVVAYCRRCGMIPIPAINTIGHWEGSPKIVSLKNSNGDTIGHDITNEAFYVEYAKVLDELMDFFGYPPYFRVGGDEANAVFQFLGSSAEKSEKLYAKVFNFAAEHLAQYNCRPVIWHDMIFAKELGGRRESDGVTESRLLPAPNILKLLSKRIVINYWNYRSGPYDGAQVLTDAGFDVWTSTWHWPDAIWKLARYTGENHLAAYDGTTWCNNHNKGGAMVLVGEYAWNSQREKVAFNPDEVFMREWSSMPLFRNVASASPLTFENAVPAEGIGMTSANVGTLSVDISRPVAAVRTVFQALENPEEAVTLRQQRPDAEIFLKGVERFVMRIPAVNGPRLYNSFALYTPSYGTTKTNMWGEDWVIRDGKVIQHASRKSDLPIPAGCGIISANETGADVQMNVRKLMDSPQVELEAGYAEVAGEQQPIVAECKADDTTLALVFGTRLYMFTERPEAAANITVTTTDGTSEEFALNVDFALAPDPHFFHNFNIVYLPKGLVAVVWRGTPERRPKKVSVQFTPIGTAIGAKLMGSVSLSEKE